MKMKAAARLRLLSLPFFYFLFQLVSSRGVHPATQRRFDIIGAGDAGISNEGVEQLMPTGGNGFFDQHSA
jgi:hypothetical protein